MIPQPPQSLSLTPCNIPKPTQPPTPPQNPHPPKKPTQGHLYNRIAVLTAGALIWGFFAFAFAFTHTVQQARAPSAPPLRPWPSRVLCLARRGRDAAPHRPLPLARPPTGRQGMTVWAFNGVGLALMIPSAQSLIADYYPPAARGAAFGALQLTGALGGMLGALYATNIAGLSVGGVEGCVFGT